MNNIFFHHGMLLLLLSTGCNPKGMVTIHVMDEEGKSIKGAEVHAQFDMNGIPFGTGSGRSIEVKCVTDSEGICEVSCRFDKGSFGARVKKEAYYAVEIAFIFKEIGGKLFRFYEPWNPRKEIVLKRIVNPIPMFSKFTLGERIPENNKPIGYDLLIGAWVEPYGKGKISDIVFSISIPENSIKGDRLTISFSKKGDGIIAYYTEPKDGISEIGVLREAPEIGYSDKLEKTTSLEEGESIEHLVRRGVSYIFRVRTKLDDNQKVVDALYGRIGGDFFYEYSRSLHFEYFLNPNPNDRNIEYNGFNLLKKIK